MYCKRVRWQQIRSRGEIRPLYLSYVSLDHHHHHHHHRKLLHLHHKPLYQKIKCFIIVGSDRTQRWQPPVQEWELIANTLINVIISISIYTYTYTYIFTASEQYHHQLQHQYKHQNDIINIRILSSALPSPEKASTLRGLLCRYFLRKSSKVADQMWL